MADTDTSTPKTRRRGPNEGTITKRKDGRWEARVSLDGGRRKCYYAQSYEDALEKLTRARADRQNGIPIITERQTVKELLESWLEDYARPNVDLGTYLSYRHQVDKHLVPQLGKHLVGKLTKEHVQRYKNRKAERFSTRTMRIQLGILRRALREAETSDLVKRNVAMLVDLPKRKTKFKATPLSLEEAPVFLKAITGDRLEAFYSVALSLGLRKGEALALTWADVNFDARTLTVSKTLKRLEGKLVVKCPKTESSNRTLDLPESLIVKLREHRRRQLEEQMREGTKWKDSGHVFTTRVGTPIDPRKINKLLTALLKRAGIRHRRFHDLRHSFGTLLLAEGEQVKVISGLLGHSRTSITEDLYLHLLPEVRKAAVDLLDSLLSSNAVVNATGR